MESDEDIIQWMLAHMRPLYREPFLTMVRGLQERGYVVGIRFFMYKPEVEKAPEDALWQQVLSIDALDTLQ